MWMIWVFGTEQFVINSVPNNSYAYICRNTVGATLYCIDYIQLYMPFMFTYLCNFDCDLPYFPPSSSTQKAVWCWRWHLCTAHGLWFLVAGTQVKLHVEGMMYITHDSLAMYMYINFDLYYIYSDYTIFKCCIYTSLFSHVCVCVQLFMNIFILRK